MMKTDSWSRREFIRCVSAAGVAFSLAEPLIGRAADAGSRFPLIAFSKAFQHLNFEETADLVAEVGWNGIECPVRQGGHVLPERVEDDLPKMADALKKRGCTVTMITTDIMNASDPLSVRVLRTASKLGIPYYRLRGATYRKNQSMQEQWQEIRAQLRDLAALNKELHICAGFQNHSGNNNVGAPVWDIYEIIKDLDPQHIGTCFDIGHATIEGGLDWPLHARLMEPFYKVVYVKDFLWKRTNRGWDAAWCPLGDGMIHKMFFQSLVRSAYRGPICQHHEYPLERGPAMVQAFKKDLTVLRQWLKEYGA